MKSVKKRINVFNLNIFKVCLLIYVSNYIGDDDKVKFLDNHFAWSFNKMIFGYNIFLKNY